jgi:metal-responsive CopG/Arc/MetJ family transcriptional regulator
MNEKIEMKQINIKLSLKQHEDLDQLSYAMGGLSKSNLIRVAIAEYVSKHHELIK